MPSLTFQAQPKHSVTAGNPVPVLKFESTPFLSGVGSAGVQYSVMSREVAVTIGGVNFPDVRFEQGMSIGERLFGDTGLTLKLAVDLHRYLIDAVESRRVDDLSGSLLVFFAVQRPGQALESFSASVELKFSEKEWVELLSAAGYRAGWTAYIERGKVEGWSEVAKHIAEAYDRLLSRDPTGVLLSCRAAFRASEKLVEADWPDLSTQIDRGSKPEPGWPPKSERVQFLREWALKMADTGGHAESYNATPEDAQLVYGLTVDLLAYLSKKEADAQRARKT